MNFVPLFIVQFRGKAARSEGKLDEAAAGGDHDQDGGARQGFHEGQTEGGDHFMTFSISKEESRSFCTY